jgi:hypothetical protein
LLEFGADDRVRRGRVYLDVEECVRDVGLTRDQ